MTRRTPAPRGDDGERKGRPRQRARAGAPAGARSTAGNAGALNYSLNGKDMGAIGQKGEVVEKTFTKENAAK